MTNAENRDQLAKWGIPDPSGVTNVLQWNVNLGLGFTGSRWMAMPSYRRVNTTLPQSVVSGHQLSFPLVEFDKAPGGSSNGWSGMDLRIFLEPLGTPPIRMLPNEKDMTNYVAGQGLAWTMDEALKRVTNHAGSASEPMDLRQARTELAALRTKYTDNHPAVRALLARIGELERLSRETPGDPSELRELKAKLAEARVSYGDNHPVIQGLLAQIKELERK